MEWKEFKSMWLKAYWHFMGIFILIGTAIGAVAGGIGYLIYNHVYAKIECDDKEY